MSDILTHQDAGVMTITFNRLDKKNAITGAMYALLANAIEHAQNTDSVKVVVLQGHETIFTAGNDISDFCTAHERQMNLPRWIFCTTSALVPNQLLHQYAVLRSVLVQPC